MIIFIIFVLLSHNKFRGRHNDNILYQSYYGPSFYHIQVVHTALYYYLYQYNPTMLNHLYYRITIQFHVLRYVFVLSPF